MKAGFRFCLLRALPVVATASIVACSGNSQTLPAAGPALLALAAAKGTGSVQIAIDVPNAKKTAVREPSYVSPGTQSASVHVSGEAPKTFDLTASSPGCSESKKTASLDCAIVVTAMAGSHTIDATLYDALKGRGSALATGTANATVVSGKTKAVTIAFKGIVATATVLLDGATTANVAAGTAKTLKVSANAYDAKDNLIAGPSAYASAVALKNSDTSGRTTLSASSIDAPDATVTLKYDGASVPSKVTSTITPSVDGKADVKGAAGVSIAPSAPGVKPGSLTFNSAVTQTFTVAESGYSGSFTASSSDPSIAAVSPGSGNAPSTTFTVTPTGGGTCTITVTNALKQSVKVSVSVSSGSIIVDGTRAKRSHGGVR
jgi:hypothetical protein